MDFVAGISRSRVQDVRPLVEQVQIRVSREWELPEVGSGGPSAIGRYWSHRGSTEGCSCCKATMSYQRTIHDKCPEQHGAGSMKLVKRLRTGGFHTYLLDLRSLRAE